MLKWKAKIDRILYDGIVIKEAILKHPFPELITNREFGKIMDTKSFITPIFNEGDVIDIFIRNSKKQPPYIIKDINSTKWNSIIYEMVGNAIYTKDIDMKQDRYSTIFSFDKRSCILDDVYLNDSYRNIPFEKGDCIEIEIKKQNLP